MKHYPIDKVVYGVDADAWGKTPQHSRPPSPQDMRTEGTDFSVQITFERKEFHVQPPHIGSVKPKKYKK